MWGSSLGIRVCSWPKPLLDKQRYRLHMAVPLYYDCTEPQTRQEFAELWFCFTSPAWTNWSGDPTMPPTPSLKMSFFASPCVFKVCITPVSTEKCCTPSTKGKRVRKLHCSCPSYSNRRSAFRSGALYSCVHVDALYFLLIIIT